MDDVGIVARKSCVGVRADPEQGDIVAGRQTEGVLARLLGEEIAFVVHGDISGIRTLMAIYGNAVGGADVQGPAGGFELGGLEDHWVECAVRTV